MLCLTNKDKLMNDCLVLQILAKKWLTENCEDCSQSSKQSHKQEIGCREISKFLGEKNWNYHKVADYLRMAEKLHPDILEEIITI